MKSVESQWLLHDTQEAGCAAIFSPAPKFFKVLPWQDVKKTLDTLLPLLYSHRSVENDRAGRWETRPSACVPLKDKVGWGRGVKGESGIKLLNGARKERETRRG